MSLVTEIRSHGWESRTSYNLAMRAADAIEAAERRTVTVRHVGRRDLPDGAQMALDRELHGYLEGDEDLDGYNGDCA